MTQFTLTQCVHCVILPEAIHELYLQSVEFGLEAIAQQDERSESLSKRTIK